MAHRSLALAAMILLAAELAGCSDTSDPLPPAADEITRSVADPAGDVFGTAPQKWDLTSLTIERDPDGITVRLDLTVPVISPASDATNGLIALVDFDVDRNAATGRTATVDEFRPGAGSTGMGVDYALAITDVASDGTVAVTDAVGREVGRVKPEFTDRHVTIRIPRLMLGSDDGYLDASAAVGSSNRASDIIPENGKLSVTP